MPAAFFRMFLAVAGRTKRHSVLWIVSQFRIIFCKLDMMRRCGSDRQTVPIQPAVSLALLAQVACSSENPISPAFMLRALVSRIVRHPCTSCHEKRRSLSVRPADLCTILLSRFCRVFKLFLLCFLLHFVALTRLLFPLPLFSYLSHLFDCPSVNLVYALLIRVFHLT